MRKRLPFAALGLPFATEGAIVYSGRLDLAVPDDGLTLRIAGQEVEVGTAMFRAHANTFLSNSVLHHSFAFGINGLNILGYGSGYPVFFGSTLNPVVARTATFIIHGWAFETESNTALRIPEPATTTLAALALGATGIVRRRRLRTESRTPGEPDQGALTHPGPH